MANLAPAFVLIAVSLFGCGPTTENSRLDSDATVTDASNPKIGDSAFPSSGGNANAVDSGIWSGGAGGSGGTIAAGGTGAAAGAGSSGGSAGSGGGDCPHPPVNSPIADDTGLADGPIVKYTAHLYYLKRPPNDEIIDPVLLPNGNYEAKVGDKIVYDSTQKNVSNQICQWENLPDWTVSDSCAFTRLGTSNPFLLQMQALAPGILNAFATIDGVTSNTIVVEAVP